MTVWGGCGPTDSNCYLDTATNFATVTTAALSNTGNSSLGDSAADTTTITGILDLLNASIKGALALVFEGATTNGITTKIAVTDPTANRTITLPDASGTVALTGGSASFNPLTSTGTTDLQGAVSNSTGNLSLNDNTDITGNLAVSGTTTTTGQTNANGGLAVSGGNLTVAANNNITQSGTGAFSTGTGAVSLNGATTINGNT